MQQTILYILFFCIGTLFGSFFTLAVYRIPLHQDITHKRSYCPNCNHKLSFFDMIPILSYIFLGGKCRYCKQKIRIRYLFLEILTGMVFLLFAMSLNLDFMQINIGKLVYLILGFFFIAGLIIIAGIDKERCKIQKELILFEIIVVCMYMIYLYTVESANIYRYVIYLSIICLLSVTENEYLRKKMKNYYPIDILQLSIIMSMFTNEMIFIFTAIFTLLAISIKKLIEIIKQGKNKKEKIRKVTFENLPIGYYLCICNILVIIIVNYFAFRGVKWI